MGVIKIMIVDDHTVVRDGLVSMLGREDNFVVVGEAPNGREAVDRLQAILSQKPAAGIAVRALAEVYATAGPVSRPDEALRLLDRTDFLYGEGIETRLRALALLGQFEEARRLIEESPFLGTARRSGLRGLISGE